MAVADTCHEGKEECKHDRWYSRCMHAENADFYCARRISLSCTVHYLVDCPCAFSCRVEMVARNGMGVEDKSTVRALANNGRISCQV